MPLPTPDTRALFRPLTADIVATLRSLAPEDWLRPTLAPAWRVRDVVAHMLDTALRRLSFHRDRMAPPPPERPIESDADFIAFINGLNATWVGAAARLSPRVLADLYADAGMRMSGFFESLPADAPPLFPVSWAGDRGAEGMLDIGREFTEVWHHGAQVREAVGAGPYADPGWLRAVLALAVQALPHAYRDVAAAPGASLAIEISGPAGGAWTVRREASGWDISTGADPDAAARATMADEAAWRLFFNALGDPSQVRLDGNLELARPLLRTRSVIV